MIAAAAGTLLAAAIVGGVAYATIPSDTNVFTACMLKNVGTIPLIDPSLSSSSLLSHCASLEAQLSWNQKGQPSAAGLPGPAGTAGPAGPAGKDGAGVNGTAEAAGANCAAGGVQLATANGVTYVCDGKNGRDGKDGTNGTTRSRREGRRKRNECRRACRHQLCERRLEVHCGEQQRDLCLRRVRWHGRDREPRCAPRIAVQQRRRHDRDHLRQQRLRLADVRSADQARPHRHAELDLWRERHRHELARGYQLLGNLHRDVLGRDERDAHGDARRLRIRSVPSSLAIETPASRRRLSRGTRHLSDADRSSSR